LNSDNNFFMSPRRAVAICCLLADPGAGAGDPVVLASRRRPSGQLALPGGKVDETDPSVTHAAARELEEETGLTLPVQAFAEHRLHQLEHDGFVVSLVSVVCPLELKAAVRNPEPDKHSPWSWWTWRGLRGLPDEEVFAPLRDFLNTVDVQTFLRN